MVMPSSDRSVRKPHRFGGIQVRICGRKIPNITPPTICGLPPHHLTNDHAAIAISDDGVIFGIVSFREGKGDVIAWPLVEGQE
jgi:hypothetical protein